MQPLDVSVFGQFKKLYNMPMDDWMRSNPGKSVTIYDITQKNITAGFQKTGIYPLSRETFSEAEFAPSQPTDRPEPQAEHHNSEIGTNRTVQVVASDDGTLSNLLPPQPSTSGLQHSDPSATGPTTIDGYISPSDILPLPKAMPRKKSAQTRLKRKSQFLTNTPVRNTIAEHMMQKGKRQPVESKKSLFSDKHCSGHEVDSSEEDSESDLEIEASDTDATSDMSDGEIIEGDFLIVKVAGKSKYLNYIVRIDSCENGSYLGVFLKKVSGRIRMNE